MKQSFFVLCIFLTANAFSQKSFTNQEVSINGFRNPSIGIEYRYHRISVHAGYYPTNFESGITTEFIKTGFTYWLLPTVNQINSSSFYVSLSYARGTSREYKNLNAGIAEIGYRWMVVGGLNLRLGIAALAANGQSTKVNPTPGISYSFFFK